MSTVKRHPIRGLLSGILLGIGVALMLFLYAVIPSKSFVPYVLVIIACAIVGVAVAMVGPARKAR